MPTNNSLYQLLKDYDQSVGDEPWVAATVVTKYRSSYRKPGAMMLIDPLGRGHGLISGGCLESDIVLQARRVQHGGSARYVVYDSTEEGNIAAELGLGCNGRVGVLVQELEDRHRTLLGILRQRLEEGKVSRLLQCFDSPDSGDLSTLILLDPDNQPAATTEPEPPLPPLPGRSRSRHQVLEADGRQWSLVDYLPPVSLWVIGGGVDAQPVVAMAATLGWRVTVVDHRPAYGRPRDFPGAEALLRETAENFEGPIGADAAIVMSHNLDMDAAWLAKLAGARGLLYTGLLGPAERKQEVIDIAGVDPLGPFALGLHGPMGFDIGGDLPESIAVSVIAQCHQVLASAGRL